MLTARPAAEERRTFLTGVVRQPDGPLGGVHLWLSGTRFEAMTDGAGRFSFGSVPAGSYVLRALRMGFAPIVRALRVGTPSDAGSLELQMVPAAVPVDAVIVTPGYFGVMQPGIANRQTLTRQQIETVPQLGEDVYRTIGRLPGVASDDYSAKFNIRGESADELFVTLDGLPLIEPYHLKDLSNALSIVDLASLGQAELIAGGPSAEFGNQLAGVFKLHSVEPRTDRVRTSAGISLTNLRAMSQGGFAGGTRQLAGFRTARLSRSGIQGCEYRRFDQPAVQRHLRQSVVRHRQRRARRAPRASRRRSPQVPRHGRAVDSERVFE